MEAWRGEQHCELKCQHVQITMHGIRGPIFCIDAMSKVHCACICRESEQVRNAPLRSRTSHVLRMQHPLATGGQPIAAPLPSHLRAQWSVPSTDRADRIEKEAGTGHVSNGVFPGSEVEQLAPAGQSGNSLVEADTSGSADANGAVFSMQNGQPLAQVEQNIRLDRDSMAEGCRQTAETSAFSGVSQITYKGIVFDLETSG